MNYIYDIITNFKENYYDFFEWNKNDSLTHFKKIPIIKINKKDYKILITNQIQMDKEQLKTIENRSETYNKKEKNNNYLLLTNGLDIIGLLFDKNGNTIKRSSLLIEEELDIINSIKKNTIYEIKYKIINKIPTIFKTRNELEKIEYIKTELETLSIKKDYHKINYLYYECFNKREKNIKYELKILKESINNNYLSNIIYNFFKEIKTFNK